MDAGCAESILTTEPNAELKSCLPLGGCRKRVDSCVTARKVSVEGDSDTDSVEGNRMRALIVFRDASSNTAVKVNNEVILMGRLIGFFTVYD